MKDDATKYSNSEITVVWKPLLCQAHRDLLREQMILLAAWTRQLQEPVAA